MPAINSIALLLLIVGGLNWGLIGLFNFDLVASIFGGTVGTHSTLSRIVYVIVGIAALYGFALLGPVSGSSDASMQSRR